MTFRIKRISLRIPLILIFISLICFTGLALGADDSIELRSSVISYNSSNNTFSGGVITSPQNYSRSIIDATNFAGFYYNLDDDISTEQFIIDKSDSGKINILYKTKPVFQKFAYQNNDWNGLGYSAIGFFASPYVALSTETLSVSSPDKGVNADKVAPLVLDDRETHQIKKGEKLSLGNDYYLIVNEIDLNGKTAWVSLYKDDREIDSGFLSSDNPTWVVEKNVLGEDVEVFRAGLSSVFQGSETAVVIIRGLWLVDFEDAFSVSSSKKYGKFEPDTISESYLSYKAEIPLSFHKTDDIGNDIKIRFSDGSGSIYKFYLYKEYTKPGSYIIRSAVCEYPGKCIFTPSSFSGLYYDLDEDLWTEVIEIDSDSSSVKKGKLKYMSFPVSKEYNFDGWTFSSSGSPDRYFVLGIFGEPYVPLNSVYGSESTLQAEKVAKLVIDSDTKYTLPVGKSLDLGSGYSLKASEINVNGGMVWLNLYKDGKQIEESIVTAEGPANSRTWVLESNVSSERDIQVMRVHVSQVFQGFEKSVVEIRGIWLIDYLNPVSISDNYDFGKFEYDGYYGYNLDPSVSLTPYNIKSGANSHKALIFSNKDNISIGKDKDVNIGGNISLKTSGAGSKYYLYVLKTIEDKKPSSFPDTKVPSDTNDSTDNVSDTNVSNKTDKTRTDPPSNGDVKDSPDFLIISSIAAFGISAALVKRNNSKKK